MNKKSSLCLFVVLFAFLLVGCGSKIAAPTGVKVEGSNLFFEGNENANKYEAVFAASDGSEQIVTVANGDDLNNIGLVPGSYTIKVRTVDNEGGRSEWSSSVTFTCNKLSAPKNVAIVNNKISFESVAGATEYKVIIVDGEGKEIIQPVTNNMLLTKFDLPAQAYKVYVVACSGELQSERSEESMYYVDLKQLDVPSGLAIDDGYIFFNASTMTDNYLIKFETATLSIEREIGAGGAEISELLIPEGTYQVSIKAIGDGVRTSDSEFSTPFEYKKEFLFMELKEKDLINAGYIKWLGRTYYNDSTKCNEIYHSASSFEVFFKGSTVIAQIHATNYANAAMRPCIVIVIDDDFDNATTLFLDKETKSVTLVSNNNDPGEHKVTVYKRSESINSHIALESIKTDGIFIKKVESKSLKIEVIAASSSTGYGNLGNASSGGQTTSNSDALQGFAFLAAQSLNADLSIFSASGWGCKASPWTTPNTVNVPDAYDYVDFNSTTRWVYEKYIPDVVIVNLGTNDYSYIKQFSGTEYDKKMTEFQQKYVEFLNHLHEIYPNAQLIVLYGLMGETSIYDATEAIVASAKVTIPNLQSIKILGDAKGYNSHPSVASHKQIAATLSAFIKEVLNLEE